MAITFALAPSPKWYFLDAQGRPAAGGTMTTFSSLDHSTPKFVFSRPDGTFPYTDPIVLDATGGSPVPMYWQFDDETEELYFLIVKDAAGNIIFSVDNFPIIGGGGVTPINSFIDIENHLVNGQFLFIDAANETESSVSPVPEGANHLAPGSGFFKNGVGGYVQELDPEMPAGWSFVKEGGDGSVDTIQFVAVTNIGEGIPNAPTANATRYFEYSLTSILTPLTDAALTNIIPGVQTFQNEMITISFDTNSTVPGNGAFEIIQFFGTPGGSPTPPPTSQSFAFSTTGWARQSFQFTVPSVVGKFLGTNNDDAIFIRWVMPLNVTGTFRLANLQIQIGQFTTPTYIEQTYAQDQYKVLIDLIVKGNLIFPTGELKWLSAYPTLTPIFIEGWMLLQDINQTLGTVASGASNAGIDVRNLYVTWWETFDQTECFVTGGRGLSALDDFNADKRMRVPQHIIGYVFPGAGVGNLIAGTNPFGSFTGTKTHTLTIPEMPAHNHTYVGPQFNVARSGTDQTASTTATVTGTTGGIGGITQPHNIMQPSFYLWIYVKL